MKREYAIEGFRYTGIYPWESKNIDLTKIKTQSRKRQANSSDMITVG